MADITKVTEKIGLVFPAQSETYNIMVSVAVTAGQTLYPEAGGTYALADADVAGRQQTRLMALESAGSFQAISALRRGAVYGFDLSGMAYDAIAYQSNTAGALSDSAGSLGVPVALVMALPDKPTYTKVLMFEPRWREDFT